MFTTAQRHLQAVTISHGGVEEIFITATAGEKERGDEMLSRALEPVRLAGATVVSQDVFGVPAGPARGDLCAGDWPVTWLSVDPHAAPPSTHIHAVCGTTVRRVRIADRAAASIYEDRSARWCRVGGLAPKDRSASHERQALGTFEELRSVLEAAGMEMRDTFRTWLYLDGILNWYGEFNRVRDGFFRRSGVFDALVPASTGIGAPNRAGAAVVAGALATTLDEFPSRTEPNHEA
jgi:enamine deaminase RidA (YjgF/YER057c/UK114 family)